MPQKLTNLENRFIFINILFIHTNVNTESIRYFIFTFSFFFILSLYFKIFFINKQIHLFVLPLFTKYISLSFNLETLQPFHKYKT